MADLSLNKDIYRKYFGQSGNQNDPSGGGLNQKNPFFENEIGRDTGDFKVSVAKKLAQLKSNEISALASINPSDYASMGSGGPGTADDDQRAHKGAYVAQQIKDEFAKGFNFGGENTLTDTYNPGNDVTRVQMENKTYKEFGATKFEQNTLPGQETSFSDYLGDRGNSEQNVASAAAAVAAEQAATQVKFNAKDLNKNGNVTIDAEKDAASAIFMSNYNDDQVFQPNFDEALAREITNTSDKDLKISSGVAFKEAQEEAAENAEKLMAEIERENELQAEKDASAALVAESLALSQQNLKQSGIDESALQRKNDVADRIKKIEKEQAKRQAELDKIAEKNAAIARAQQNLDWAAQNLKQQKIKESALQRKDDVANRIEKIEKIKERNEMWADINDNNDKILATQKFADDRASIEDPVGPAYEPGVVSGQTLYGNMTNKIVEATKEAEQDAQNKTTKVDMEKTIGELAAERAERERLAELHNRQINSTTADDIADVKPPKSVAQQTEENAANLNAKKEAEVKVDTPSKSQTENKYPAFKTLGNGDGSLHGKDPFRFTTLEYPKNITSDGQYGHYILFYVNVQNKTKYSYVGYNDDGNMATIGDVIETQTYKFSTFDSDDTISTVAPTDRDYTTNYHYNTGAGADPVAFQKEAYGRVYEGGRANILQSNQVTLMRQRKATQGIASRMNAAGKPLTSRITDSVAMYLPGEIGNSTSTKYQGAELGMLGYLALGGADLLGQLANRDFAGMGDTAVGMIDAAITEGLKKSAVAAADLFSGASTQGSIDKVFGQTVNPFIEVAFENMGVRSFDYTFNFSPKSKEETDEVRAIIQLFRFHMVPELKGSNHRYLTLPSTFDIHYMYQASPEESKENTYYNKIATCVLESCDVNYAPSGVKSFDDGAPTQISMTLRFMETEMLTKEKVNKGF